LNFKSDWKLTKTESHPFVCAYYNTVAPTFVVTGQQFSTSAKGLLVTAYGAYGTPTKIGRLVQRWRPLLNAGWAIASVAVPGSGDHDLAWRFQGQAKGRKLAIDTLCATVKDLQEELGVGPAQTALYGRSAGGLLVSATLNVCKGLVGAVYMESPYVDALRTISNPKLPLTVLETKEFGIGTNPADIISMGAWSPMEHIPSEGYPDIFIVARTDAADLEVYPYEVLKYISRVRGEGSKGNSQPKLLYVSADKGHFTTDQETRAEDLALLDNWLNEVTGNELTRTNKNHINKYKMMPARVNKNMTRKNKNKDRKNKNNTAMRKNKNRKNRTNKNRRNRH
jgi:protease II